jgi:TPR repeat protein
MGVLLVRGSGLAKDPVEAAKWFRLAAEQDSAAAQFNLGLACAEGNGTDKNLVEAYQWFSLAAERGDPEAAQERDQLVDQLTATQLLEGVKRSTEFRKRQAAKAADAKAVKAGGVP